MKRLLSFLLPAVLGLGFAVHARAATNAESELMITMATIEYQAGDFPKCRKTLNTLLKKEAANTAALELLALTQRKLNEDMAAATTYEQLLKKGTQDKLPAYHFELAMIRFKQKREKEALKHFRFAANGNFNGGTSNFYAGLLEFNAKEWQKARSHFTASLTYTDGKSMEPVTRYYLANTYAQLGKTDAAVQNYYEAENTIAERAKSPAGLDSTSKGIRTNVLKELKALDVSQPYGSVSLLQQFDSNVQTNPSEVENPTAASSQRSGKAVLSVSAGYVSSPTRDFQFHPSFNYYTNYNYNFLARDFNFMSFTPSLLMMYKPYARLTGGLKAQGVFSMQNMLDPEQSRRDLKYRPFSLTGDAGPVVKFAATPKLSLGAEAYWRPKRFYLDPATGRSRRSGGGILAKGSAEYVSGFGWWNPSGYFSWEWDHPGGKDYHMYALGAGLSNTMSLTEKLSITGSFDILSTDYNETRPKRDDLNMTARLSGSYPIVEKVSASADVSYTTNSSSLSTLYKYERWVGSLGASYSL